MIKNIKTKKDLSLLEKDDYAYFRGHFIRCFVIPNPNRCTQSCPCETHKCVFANDKKEAETDLCPFAKQCMAHYRKDKQSVVFERFKPSEVAFNGFASYCKNMGYTFKPL